METSVIVNALQSFADEVKSKSSQITSGNPEDQLRSPFEKLMISVAASLGWKIVCTGETPLPERLGRPDFAIHLNDLLSGFVELKAPGIGASSRQFKGHNLDQFKRFSVTPNILYTDGNEWAIYRNGNLVNTVVRLSGDIVTSGAKAVSVEDAWAIENLLRDFFLWEPFIPAGNDGKIDLKAFAELLAPVTRMLRDDVVDALMDTRSPLVELASNWRQLLFPEASDEQFADAYAQTVAFALLLGRSEGAEPLTLNRAEEALEAQHNLLSRALQVLTDSGIRSELSAPIDLLIRVIAAVPLSMFSSSEDPWLYFYEDFLTVYDPKLRKDAGVYYTPVEVVHCQVRLIDDLLVNRLNKSLGFADPDVVTLDPAAGTGTYLLGVIEHALERVEIEQGPGAVAGKATELANNLFGFELMVGPFAVADLRVSRALRDHGGTLPADGPHVYLTDTLESPDAEPPQLPLFLRPIAEQHIKALKVKSDVPVIVCLGNPPYDRHQAATIANKASTGGWVRWGNSGSGKDSIFRDFVEPATHAGHGIHVKWLYNLYAYFWRWALWKVFESKNAQGPGVVTFITAASYLFSDAFVGMREHMRRQCDEIWILDLGGEGRGGRKDENVFAIQTPVVIAIAFRSLRISHDKPAKVKYARIEGSRDTKLAALDNITDFKKVNWQNCPNDWQSSFLPVGEGNYFNWLIIRDIFPWQHSGLMLKRTWPIGPEKNLLESRWKALLAAKDRSVAFRGSGDREVSGHYKVQLTEGSDTRPLDRLSTDTPVPPVMPYSYRSFDRQYLIADNRLIARPRTELWNVHGNPSDSKQLYLVSQLWQVLGSGPALTACVDIPDFHFFKGSYGGRDLIPLYRTADASEVNILPGLLELLSAQFKKSVTPEDFLAYVYGALAHPAFTARFHRELETRELRVPITKDAKLFEKMGDLGVQLLWLHTYGERFVPDGKQQGQVPQGSARCMKAVPGQPDGYPESFDYNEATGTLHVGEGEFAPVDSGVFEFEVSGLKVVQSWLKYRMKKGSGKKSSPLDDIRPERWSSQFTTELLELLWVLEATLKLYPEQANLLDAIIDSECFNASDFPPVPDRMRKPPKQPKIQKDQIPGLDE
ncbi:N-6 DNA methylase [bacterium]|nr:N-6 DNA methylase [bacterium]